MNWKLVALLVVLYLFMQSRKQPTQVELKAAAAAAKAGALAGVLAGSDPQYKEIVFTDQEAGYV